MNYRLLNNLDFLVYSVTCFIPGSKFKFSATITIIESKPTNGAVHLVCQLCILVVIFPTDGNDYEHAHKIMKCAHVTNIEPTLGQRWGRQR